MKEINYAEIIRDPDFVGMEPEEQRKVIRRLLDIDPRATDLPPEERDRAAEMLLNRYMSANLSGQTVQAEKQEPGLESFHDTYAKWGRPIAELAGMALGGAAGTALWPGPGTLAGAGVGYSLARQGERSIRYLLGQLPEEAPEERLKEALTDIGKGAAYEAVGRAVPAAIAKGWQTVVSPYSKKLTEPTAQFMKRWLEEKNIPHSVSDVVDSWLAKRLESYYGGTSLSLGGKYEALYKARKEGFTEAAKEITSKARSFDIAELIDVFRSTLKGASKAQRARLNALYEKLAQHIDPEGVIPLKNTKEAALRLLKEEEGLPESLRSQVNDILTDLTEREGLTWNDYFKWQSKLSKLARQYNPALRRPESEGLAAWAEEKYGPIAVIKKALTQDAESYAASKGTDVVEFYNFIKGEYKNFKQFWNSPLIRKLINEADPEAVLTDIFGVTKGGYPPLSRIRKIKSVVPEDLWETLSLKFLEAGPLKPDDMGIVSFAQPGQFVKKYGKEALKEILPKDTYRKFIELAEAGRRLQEGFLSKYNVSETANTYQQFAKALNLIVRPTVGTVMFLTGHALGKLFVNPKGIDYLLERMKWQRMLLKYGPTNEIIKALERNAIRLAEIVGPENFVEIKLNQPVGIDRNTGNPVFPTSDGRFFSLPTLGG